jgi:hypothetical protein
MIKKYKKRGCFEVYKNCVQFAFRVGSVGMNLDLLPKNKQKSFRVRKTITKYT